MMILMGAAASNFAGLFARVPVPWLIGVLLVLEVALDGSPERSGDPLAGDRPRSFPASQPARTAGPFGRFVDESQKRIPLRLLDIAIEKVDPAIGMINGDQSLGAIEGTDA